MSVYVLECSEEGERLEKQNSARLYNVENEISEIDFKEGSRILDVGCGTGALTRSILNNYKNVHITGVDLSSLRQNQAADLIQPNLRSRVRFVCDDITKDTLSENAYDYVVSRFVMHHLEDPLATLRSMKRTLKPSGEMVIIDSDGILFNFFCNDLWIMSALDKIRSNFKIDMFAARKMKSYFHKIELTKVRTRIIPMHFSGEDMKLEAQQYRERFVFMKPVLEKILGESDYLRFSHGYVAALESGEAELFYNKFVCQGIK